MRELVELGPRRPRGLLPRLQGGDGRRDRRLSLGSSDSIATGGSDYHGDLGTYAEAHATLWVPPEVGEALWLGGGSSLR